MAEKTPSPDSDAARSDPAVADKNRQALKEEAEKRVDKNRHLEKKNEERT